MFPAISHTLHGTGRYADQLTPPWPTPGRFSAVLWQSPWSRFHSVWENPSCLVNSVRFVLVSSSIRPGSPHSSRPFVPPFRSRPDIRSFDASVADLTRRLDETGLPTSTKPLPAQRALVAPVRTAPPRQWTDDGAVGAVVCGQTPLGSSLSHDQGPRDEKMIV